MNAALTFHRLLAIGALLLALQWLTENPAPLLPGWPLLLVSTGALIAAPLGLEVLRRNGIAAITVPPVAWLAAWLGLTSSLAGAPGWLQAGPWLLTTVYIAWQAVTEFRRGERTVARTVALSGPAMLAIGGAWWFADRMQMEPLGFDFLIVRLTAAHFHFAGFVLPIVAGLVLGNWPRRALWLRIATAGVLAGVPLVAAGITTTRLGCALEWECVFAAFLSLCAATVGISQAALAVRLREPRPVVRVLLAVSGVALTAGMALALLYALRPWISLPWLHLPRMWAWHGSIQVFGFALPGLLGWLWLPRRPAA